MLTPARAIRIGGGSAERTDRRASVPPPTAEAPAVRRGRGPSGGDEADRAHVRLGAAARVVRVDPDGQDARVFRRPAVDLLEVFEDVPALGDPLAELGGAGPHDHVSDRARLLA